MIGRWALALFMVTVALEGRDVRADGVSIQSTIGMRELVAKSPTIIKAKILSTNHVRGSREAYGETRDYVARYQFQVAVEATLRGPAPQATSSSLWISYRGDPLPGKWVLVREWYETEFSPHTAKVGERILVFLGGEATVAPSAAEDEAPMLHAIEIESIGRLRLAKAEIAKARGPAPRTRGSRSGR